MNPALTLLPVLAIIAAVAAIAAAAGKVKVRGTPAGPAGILLAASILSAAAAIATGADTTTTVRDLAVTGMAWTLAASLLALGIACSGALLHVRSIPVVILSLLLVGVETGVPLLAGHLLGWSPVEVGAMSSNAAAAVAALAGHAELRSDASWWGAFGIRYLVQMILPLLLIGWYLRSERAVGHHSRTCKVFARALSLAAASDGKKQYELTARKDCPLSDILAVADIIRVDRGDASIRAADLPGGIAEGDIVAVECSPAARARIATLVGHVDHRWPWWVAGIAVVGVIAGLRLAAHLSLPVAALIAAVVVGAAMRPAMPAAGMRVLRRYGLLGFLVATGLALGGQCVGLSVHDLLTYGVVAIATSVSCWYAAVWGGPLILGRASPKMRSLGVLAGSTTSSGLSETIATRTGSDVAVVAFAAAYPLASVAKVVVVALILR